VSSNQKIIKTSPQAKGTINSAGCLRKFFDLIIIQGLIITLQTYVFIGDKYL
jgi:hypothetical protein